MAVKHPAIEPDDNTYSNVKWMKHSFAWSDKSIKTDGSENILKPLDK